jgi:hypothetical protein
MMEARALGGGRDAQTLAERAEGGVFVRRAVRVDHEGEMLEQVRRGELQEGAQVQLGQDGGAVLMFGKIGHGRSRNWWATTDRTLPTAA